MSADKQPAAGEAHPSDAPMSSESDTLIHCFAQLAASGSAIPEGLEAAAGELGRGKTAEGLRSVAARIRRGSDALSTDFTQWERFVVAQTVPCHGESLVQRISQLSVHAQSVSRLRRDAWVSLVYPAFLVVAALAMATIVGWGIVPLIAQVYTEFDLEQDVGVDFIFWWHRYMWAVLLALALLALVTIAALARFAPRRVVESMSRRLPLLGIGLSYLDASEMCRNVSSLLACGVTYPDALRTTGAVTRSPQYQRWLQEAEQTLRRGGDLQSTAAYLPRVAMLILVLVGNSTTTQERPAEGWQAASGHFWRCATAYLQSARNMAPILGYFITVGICLAIIQGLLSPLVMLIKMLSSL